jgi:Ni/Co efflux regulator RcnB
MANGAGPVGWADLPRHGAEMNTKAFFAALMAACMLLTSPAFARDDDRKDRREDRQERIEDRREDRQERLEDRRDDRREDRRDRKQWEKQVRQDQRHFRQDHRRSQYGYSGRGAGPRHDMRKGGRLSREYRDRRYVVNDWRSHRLSAPPRGYHWVRTGGDFVLVGSDSGLIFQIFLN